MNVLDALRYRHAKDVFVDECKMGSSWNGSRRLDGWALLKTWSPLTIVGYEIKTSRSDFLQDRKWVEYLPVCHEMYFVCPAKLIAPEELPADVGLLWTTQGTRLQNKRKAVRREPDPAALNMLMAYVLMSRTRIVENMWAARDQESNEAFWRRWLTEKNERHVIGRDVSKRLTQIVNDLRARTQRAESERDRLEHVQERLVELGLDKSAGSYALRRLTPGADLPEIKRLAQQIERLANGAA